MSTNQDSGRHASFAVLACLRALMLFIAVCAGLRAHAQHSKDEADSKDEAFEQVDPYTRGAKPALDKLGYSSFGPFPWHDGVRTSDVEQELGGLSVLWVETPHFKLGSTLKTYKLNGQDQRESKKLEKEIARFSKRLGRAVDAKNKLDPWLRLHLYAQRLEDVHADFVQTFALDLAAFERKPAKGAPYMGEGPHLGQPLKPTVLLVEKRSTIARFAKRYLGQAGEGAEHALLPGGSVFYGMSAEQLAEAQMELDTALHCVVAADTTLALLDGFRNNHAHVPLWFRIGLMHIASRKIDDRFTYYAAGTSNSFEDGSHRWEPRVRGLLDNDYELPWADMLAWSQWSDLNPQRHMLVWSRAAWLLQLKDGVGAQYLMAITDPPPALKDAELQKALVERSVKALERVSGRSLVELDTAWRAFVLKTYAKK
jgi:hypothetical protein